MRFILQSYERVLLQVTVRLFHYAFLMKTFKDSEGDGLCVVCVQ